MEPANVNFGAGMPIEVIVIALIVPILLGIYFVTKV